jgi:hypothetical protein
MNPLLRRNPHPDRAVRPQSCRRIFAAIARVRRTDGYASVDVYD